MRRVGGEIVRVVSLLNFDTLLTLLADSMIVEVAAHGYLSTRSSATLSVSLHFTL